MSRRGWLLFVVMSVLWGIPYMLIKVAVGGLDPATLVFARTFIGAALLVPLAAWRRELWPVLRYWRPLVAYTAAELAVPWVLLSDAERRLSSSLSGLLVAAVPLVTAALSAAAGSRWARRGRGGHPSPGSGRERLGLVGVGGLMVGLLGVGLLLGLDVRARDAASVGEVAVVVVGYSLGPMIAARRLGHLPSLGVVAASLTLCAVSYLPAALVEWPARMPAATVLASTVVLGVVCTALAFVLFFALIGESGPTRATLITYLNPAVAVIFGVAFLGDHFGVGSAAGFALILAGCALATRRAPAVAST